MAYTVTAPCVVIPNADGMRLEFYDGAVLPDGLDADHLAGLVEAGMVTVAESKDPEPEEPAPGTIPAVLAEVGEDPEKALAALEAEKASDKPRATLIGKLEAIVEKATDGAS